MDKSFDGMHEKYDFDSIRFSVKKTISISISMIVTSVILIRYDTIEEFNVDSKAEYRVLQLNLAHVARNYKQSQCLFNSVQVKIHEDSPEGKE